MRIATVVGNRPQFIKAAAVSGLLRKQHEEILIHSGQHYDDELSEVFFREFGLPQPDCELGVGSGTHARQTATVMTELEPVIGKLAPDLVLIYGDTNTTLAAALVCAKLGYPIAHVESGMRCFDRSMPEEINRVVADHLSDLLFCSSATAVGNLASEGVTDGVFEVGDVMIDVALKASSLKAEGQATPERLGLEAGGYYLVTAHRAGNVDNPKRLRQLVSLIEQLPGTVVFPIHPRTRASLEKEGLYNLLEKDSKVVLTPGLGYLDFQGLLRRCRAVLTDSGGVQKEAYLFGVRCITLRDTTEWVETVDSGWNFLTDLDSDAVFAALERPLPDKRPELYGAGNAAKRLVEALSMPGVKVAES